MQCHIPIMTMLANISRLNQFFFRIYRVIRDGYICPFNLKAWQHLYSEAHRERYRGVNSIHKRDLSSHLLSASHPRHRSLVCLDFLIVRKDSTGSCSPKISKVLSFFSSFGSSGNDAYPESPLFDLYRSPILLHSRKVSINIVN